MKTESGKLLGEEMKGKKVGSRGAPQTFYYSNKNKERERESLGYYTPIRVVSSFFHI